MITRSQRIFLTAALWVPIVMLVVLLIIDWAAGYSGVSDWKQFLMNYALAFGIPAYLAFVAWATRALSKITEQQILKKIWCAPLTFIPFYAAPWLIGGLVFLLFGQVAGFGLMVMWVALLPYLLIAGYVVCGLTVALYRTVFS